MYISFASSNCIVIIRCLYAILGSVIKYLHVILNNCLKWICMHIFFIQAYSKLGKSAVHHATKVSNSLRSINFALYNIYGIIQLFTNNLYAYIFIQAYSKFLKSAVNVKKVSNPWRSPSGAWLLTLCFVFWPIIVLLQYDTSELILPLIYINISLLGILHSMTINEIMIILNIQYIGWSWAS